MRTRAKVFGKSQPESKSPAPCCQYSSETTGGGRKETEEGVQKARWAREIVNTRTRGNPDREACGNSGGSAVQLLRRDHSGHEAVRLRLFCAPNIAEEQHL